MPIVGDVISYTVAPIIGEAIGWPSITKMFAPQPVSPMFEREFPMPLALRPSQIKAFSQDTSHMITAAGLLSPRYRTITCPTVVMAGDADRIVNVERQAQRLHGAIPGSRLDVLNGAGHMIHHLDPARMVRAIDLIATGGITRATMQAEAATWGTAGVAQQQPITLSGSGAAPPYAYHGFSRICLRSAQGKRAALDYLFLFRPCRRKSSEKTRAPAHSKGSCACRGAGPRARRGDHLHDAWFRKR